MNPRLGNYRLLAEVLCELGRPEDALEVLEQFPRTAEATAENQYAELAWVEARCLRLAGRVDQALAAARRDVRIVEASNDAHDLMLTLEELAACEEAAGDLEGALADTREVKRHLWAIHLGQTRQLVQQVWAHVDLERDRKNLQTQAAEATRSAEQDALTGIGNRRLLERFLQQEAARQTEVACVVADIDSFKKVNDTFVMTSATQCYDESVSFSRARCEEASWRFVTAAMSSSWPWRASTWPALAVSPSGFGWRSPASTGQMLHPDFM
jgi:hypothetical protein